MAGKIYFKKAGRHVESLGHETVLETGLKAGIALKYRCSNGNCGECKARLLDGSLHQTRHHDFLLTEADKINQAFLMCSNAPDGDVVVAADSVGEVGDIPTQIINARVKNLSLIDDQVALLHLRTPRTDRLQFMAGQSVKLGGNNNIPEGIYPVASCPCDDMNLFFHIPRIPDDPFSELVFSGEAEKCRRIRITGPEGDFVFNTQSNRLPVFIAWHTGFAPAKSLIETAVSVDDSRDLHLFRFSPTSGPHYMDNVCRAWSDALDHFHYHPSEKIYRLTSTTSDAESVLRLLPEKLDHPPVCDFYIIGPPAFTGGASRVLVNAGVNPRQIKTCHICMGLLC